MRTWKDSRWLPRVCALLYVAMFVIAIQLAWGCAESNSQMVEPIERDVISVSKILLPQEFDEPFIPVVDSSVVIFVPIIYKCDTCLTIQRWLVFTPDRIPIGWELRTTTIVDSAG